MSGHRRCTVPDAIEAAMSVMPYRYERPIQTSVTCCGAEEVKVVQGHAEHAAREGRKQTEAGVDMLN
jgi:hypothetical protein